VCRDGVRNVLAHLGIWANAKSALPREQPCIVDVRSDECYSIADREGVFVPLVALGELVRSGDPIARIHRPEAPQCTPLLVRSQIDGIVMARRALARTSRGDWLFVIGRRVAAVLPE
jgi:predicted deacylase